MLALLAADADFEDTPQKKVLATTIQSVIITEAQQIQRNDAPIQRVIDQQSENPTEPLTRNGKKKKLPKLRLLQIL